MRADPNLMPIRTINADQAGAIAETGRPAGRWIWRADDKTGLWRGAIADGVSAETVEGSFPVVLTHMMIRAGLLKKSGRARVVNASRDPEWRVSRDTDPGLRVPGARIRKWEEPVTVTELPRVLVVNTERAAEKRAAAESAEPVRRTGRPAGSGTGQTVGGRITRERIARMVCGGATDAEIAEGVRLAVDTVQKYINEMRREGAFPNDKLPAWRVRRFQQTERRRPNLTPDEVRVIRALRAAGLTYTEIAARTGVLLSVVASRCRDVGRGETDAVPG